jgi:uncharacterized repeat protein (TIGR01451 family)
MKLKLSLLLACLCSTICNSQIGFSDNTILDTDKISGDVHQIISVDFDNDGDSDLLVATHDIIGWFENLEAATDFSKLNVIAEIETGSSQPSSVFVEDFDNDGDKDVVYASSFENTIYWCENMDGLGNFGDRQMVSSDLNYVLSIISADIDGDGDYDIVSASRDDDKIAWYENTNGLGDFGNQQIISITAEPHSVISVDLDMDGDMDIISNSFTEEKIIWYENLNGLGNFSDEIIIDQLEFYKAESMISSDLDNDGDMDLIVGYYTFSTLSDRLVWLENLDGLGNFGSSQIITTEINGIRSVFVTDFDNDGDNDILSASEDDGKIAWYENLDSNGDFGNQNIISDNSDDVKTISVADIDDDGVFDVIAGSSIENQMSEVVWFYNNSSGVNFPKLTINVGYGQVGSVHQADFNNDGNTDILSGYSNPNHDKLIWIKNISGDFDNPSPQFVSTFNNNIYSVLPTDINNDNFVDVFAVTNIENNAFWLENIGPGFLAIQNDIANDISGVPSLLSADIDGDNLIDIVVASNNNNEIVWYKNINGVGAFSSANTITDNALSARSVYASDIDNDGDMDILSAISFQDKIAWYENLDGLGNFSNEKIITLTANSAYSVYSADIDGDGDEDVLSASDIDDKIAWYENLDGLGNFGAEQIISTDADGARAVTAGDLDNDGDMDVISASEGDGKIAWYENQNGLGGFSSQKIISLDVEFAKSVFTIDIDNDGDMDVISSGSDKIIIHENLGIINQISGTIKLDLNSNGCDDNDLEIPNVLVIAEKLNESFASFTQENGSYLINVVSGEYNVSIISPIENNYQSNPDFYTVVFTNINDSFTGDFCLEPIQIINDLNISIIPDLDDPRPGFDTSYQIVYKNIGTEQLTGSITFQFDSSKMNFLGASESINSQSAGIVTFDFSDLNPFETRTINLDFNILTPPTTNIDDILVFTATINPITNDATENDNVFSFEQTVIGSYDPNDITVLEGDEILFEDVDKYLHYVIRFQNTGTASAINVKVSNTLDQKLDWTTMQLESLSHTGRVEITNGSEINFIFDDINLPDSTNDELNSHGFVAYKIYFDFNPPIITNTVSTEIIDDELSIQDDTQSIFKLYPNPTNGLLSITSNLPISIVKVYNSIGQLMYLCTNSDSIDLSNFESGIYIIELKDINNSVEWKKIIKR